MNKVCIVCNISKEVSDFRNRNTCKVCENKIRYQKKKEKRKNDSLYDEKLKKYDVQRKRRKELNPIHRTIQSLRSHLRKIRNDRGYIKNGNMSKIIGIEWNEFKIYFESKFQPGMNWDNHGEWEYDHIIPVSSASSIDEIERLFHYTNLQPLWKEDNRRKGNKIL